MNEAHTQYKVLKYDWTLHEDEVQIATGAFETKARMEYESPKAFETGISPVKVYHISAQKKSRVRALTQLVKLDRLQESGKWGAWRIEKADTQWSAPLRVDGKQAFRLYLEVK